MAKKKKSRKSQKKELNYSVEMIGLLLILIGILGFGFGFLGAMIKKFAMFLIGEWWAIILLLLLYLGLYMLVKKKLPSFFSSKLVGVYILLLVVLTASHYSYINTGKAGEIINNTMNTYQARINTMGTDASIFTSGQSSYDIGGGIIGALCAVGLGNLVGSTGTYIVLVVLALFATVMLFDIDYGEIVSKIKDCIFKSDNEIEQIENDNLINEENEVVPEKKGFSLFGKKNKDNEAIINEGEPDTSIVSPVEISAEVQNSNELENEHHSTNRAYKVPGVSLLDELPKQVNKTNSNDFTKSNKIILERVLADFEIKGTVVEIHVGPAVTQYEVAVSSGTKLSKVVAIDKEIALALAAKSVSIEAPIPGKSTVGVTIPNPSISAVKIREVLGFVPKDQDKGNVVAALGKDLMGKVQTMDITKTPHLLVAGSTGSGKSVCMNSIIASILMRYKPEEVKLVLVDPKKVEMSNYNGIPHLLWPVINDPKAASVALQRIVAMMDERYDKFAETGVKKVEEYNDLAAKKGWDHLPYIIVIIDELADLMMVASKEVEGSIQRITQLARAAGIHLIVATQRPSTNVITGVIKANIPSRIAFAVASQIDSRTILDTGGAEKLLGRGDMLFLPMGQNTPTRIQGCWITDDEIRRLIEYVTSQQEASYDDSLQKQSEMVNGSNGIGTGGGGTDDDPLYNEIYDFAVSTGKVSASLIQRRFRLGYNRAARIIDLLEERGVIGPQNGSKPREVLVGKNGEEDE
ncbi:MAG: DNA translocase FtsK [Candidatus Coprovivens sp.]